MLLNTSGNAKQRQKKYVQNCIPQNHLTNLCKCNLSLIYVDVPAIKLTVVKLPRFPLFDDDVVEGDGVGGAHDEGQQEEGQLHGC